ncbi:hypothetical protein FHR81_002166 [Actinoalloteichus hoggarensis]|uniref:Uncharacterized protein n=1 Tax=Actinoalloteichus hoggarensis TaxID=1470176 RepID=A0A221W5S5_9PSEU|nr:hypothetical protein [Actinoalloteichus hoggarensis]ASO21198.1 hypothetical protein AHOG_17865 [Actinoalloteichus hoggarensis]MBB5921128.1 hypothetical protein [Actinoalloteichus hoggarensis]
MTRRDLLALTTEALISLANRGLVKRAAKDLDAGVVPEVTLDADGTVHARFPDGVATALPVGAGLDAARCTCASASICRHRIGLVLAYQRQTRTGTAEEAAQADESAAGRSGPPPEPADAESGDPPVAEGRGVRSRPPETSAEARAAGSASAGAAGAEAAAAVRAGAGSVMTGAAATTGAAPASPPWSPGDVDDEALREVVGARAMTTARRLYKAGYPARVCRAGGADAVPRVELSSCTVRFLVPGELAYAHTDAGGASRGEFVVLAVWAFRAADEHGLTGDDVRLDVGGDVTDTATSGIEPALPSADQLIVDGVMHAGPTFVAELRRTAAILAGRELHWPAAAVIELAEQLTAYAERSAHHRASRVAELLVELHARHRAVVNAGASPRSRVLGTGEPARTALRRVRLTSLGARITGTAAERTVEVFLAHVDSGTVLVLRRRYATTGEGRPTGHELAARRIAGTSLRSLAAADIVSESASRTAGRLLQITDGRVARTTVLPLGTAWERLPEPLLVTDFAAAALARAELPPRLIRPRVEAEDVHVIRAAAVVDVGYHPGDQRLDAVIADAAGDTMTVSARHRAAAPGALDALAEALHRHDGESLLLSGLLSRDRGRLVLDPIAVLSGQTLLVPDLAPGIGDAALAAARDERATPLDSALETALSLLAEAAHRGVRHPSPGMHRRVRESAHELRRVGLRTAAALTEAFAATLETEDLSSRAEAWLAAQLQLLVTAESR